MALPLSRARNPANTLATPMATPMATPAKLGKGVAAQLFSAVATPATPKREHLQNCALRRVALPLPAPRLYCFYFYLF